MLKHQATMIGMVVVLLVAGCQPLPIPFPPSPEIPSRLNVAISDEPPTLDPHRTSDVAAAEVFEQVCETLVYRGFDLTDQPLLAESWEMAPDGLSVTFKLRQGIIFHDGNPLDSAAVKFTFERLQQPESVESPIHEEFEDVSIETPDEQTIVFSFDEPRQDFVEALRNVYAVIISPSAVQEGEEEFGRHPICTGPFQVADWRSSQYILLTKNPDYSWPPGFYANRGPSHIDEIKVNFVGEHDTRYLALLNGELDMLSLSTSEEVEEIEEIGEFYLLENWIGGISYLGFNYQHPPTNEPLLRQALAHAVDKTTIINAILPGLADPAFAPLAPSIFGFSSTLEETEYQYDPEQSRQLLAEAGYADSNGDGIVERDGEPLKLDLLTTTSSTYDRIFTLLQSQLRDVGVDIEIRAVPTAEISQITPSGGFDLLLYHYNWPFPSALSLFLSSDRVGASNRVAYSNTQVDELLELAAQQPEGSQEKFDLLVKAQRTILQDTPWQPLLVRKRVTAVNDRVQGIKAHPAEGLLLHDATIVDKSQ